MTYDPRRQQGVYVYRDRERAFSVGDRVQFTAPANDLKVANRELGTIQSIADDCAEGEGLYGSRAGAASRAIRDALKPEDAAQFQWIAEIDTIQGYRHTETGRNIHIDDKGQFYSQDGKSTSQEAALDRAMPQEWKQEQMEIGIELGIGR